MRVSATKPSVAGDQGQRRKGGVGGMDEPKETARSCQPSVPITQRLRRETAGRGDEETSVRGGGSVENVCVHRESAVERGATCRRQDSKTDLLTVLNAFATCPQSWYHRILAHIQIVMLLCTVVCRRHLLCLHQNTDTINRTHSLSVASIS